VLNIRPQRPKAPDPALFVRTTPFTFGCIEQGESRIFKKKSMKFWFPHDAYFEADVLAAEILLLLLLLAVHLQTIQNPLM
jgi:hypothetical protein